MRRLLAVLMLVFCFAIPTDAPAAVVALNLTPADTGIIAAPLTGNPSTTLRSDGYQAATLYIVYTRAAASAVNVSCQAGPAASVTQGPVAVASVNSTTGAVSLVPGAFSYPVTTSGVLRLIIAPLNDLFLTCTFSGTGATSSDLISLHARLGAY